MDKANPTQSESTELARDGAVTINDAVAWSGIGRSTLYNLIGDGQVKTAKIGKRRLVLRASLREFLAKSIPADKNPS